ncbi:hypothetical protein Fmac_031683 [Flemingia macrophylla]|uniref:Uncharacterized protein n=1 Tax=Flemingia macrophylla TaxID=520843 RepID=A0ABD1L2R5_9FABA
MCLYKLNKICILNWLVAIIVVYEHHSIVDFKLIHLIWFDAKASKPPSKPLVEI